MIKNIIEKYPGLLPATIMALYFAMIDFKAYYDSTITGFTSLIVTEIIALEVITLIIIVFLTNYLCNKRFSEGFNGRKKK